MARKYWRRQVLLVKPEVTYGVDPTPTGIANAILAESVELTPMDSQNEERGYMTPYFGAKPSMRTVLAQKLVYSVELAGAGTAGGLPGYGPSLRGCGLKATATVGTDVQFEPVSTGQESMAHYINIDGQQYILLGSRGDAEITIEAQKRPLVKYTYTSLWQAPAAVGLQVPTLTGFTKPLIASKANTIVTLGAWSATMAKATIRLGNTVTSRFLIGDEEVLITDRKVTGELVLDATDLATFNPFITARDGVLTDLHIVHGAAAGKIIDISLPTLELQAPTLGQADGILQWTIPFNALPTDGDDELLITVK
jgi:hypothetical protein